MVDNKNQGVNMGKATFAFFSLKAKLIIIGVAIFIFIVVIFPVVAIMSIFSNNDTQSNQKQGGESSTSPSSYIAINEVVEVENMKKYNGATFPMPFETWDPDKDVVTSKFSLNRTITVNGVTQSRAHTGIDLVVVSVSDPKICAVYDGKVVVSKAGNTGYGNYVVIQHTASDNTTFYTLYGHMKAGSIMVSVGTKVTVGQVLGIMGSTGNSTGKHLHFEIRLNNNSSSSAVDPYTYLFGS